MTDIKPRRLGRFRLRTALSDDPALEQFYRDVENPELPGPGHVHIGVATRRGRVVAVVHAVQTGDGAAEISRAVDPEFARTAITRRTARWLLTQMGVRRSKRVRLPGDRHLRKRPLGGGDRRLVVIDGLLLEEERVAGNGTTFAFVHGHGLGAWEHRAQLREAARRGVAAAALTLPGYPGSDPLPRREEAIGAMNSVVQQWLSRLEGDRIHLVGHSLGTLPAMFAVSLSLQRLARVTLLAPPVRLRRLMRVLGSPPATWVLRILFVLLPWVMRPVAGWLAAALNTSRRRPTKGSRRLCRLQYEGLAWWGALRQGQHVTRSIAWWGGMLESSLEHDCDCAVPYKVVRMGKDWIAEHGSFAGRYMQVVDEPGIEHTPELERPALVTTLTMGAE